MPPLLSAPMLRVLIDGRTMGNPHSAGRGAGRYVSALFERVPGRDRVSLSALVPPGTAVPPGVSPVPMRRVTRRPGLPWRAAWEQHVARLGSDIRRAGPDVFHSPHFDPPLSCPCPWVQTLHDVITLVYPHPWFAWERRLWGVRAPVMRRADAVIAISRHTADLGVRLLGLPAHRLHVVYHGVTPVFRPGPPRVEPDPPFLLYVSAFALHKGHGEAFEVIGRIAEAGLPHVLKVVGGIPAINQPAVQALRREARHTERVELLGHVPDEELVFLYREATALIVTSRYEGFGLPVIEAQACGTPVVSFDNSCLPEILGDAGILVPDGDVGRFAAALIALTRDEALRRDLAARGLERAKLFDWDRCADEHIEIYKSVA